MGPPAAFWHPDDSSPIFTLLLASDRALYWSLKEPSGSPNASLQLVSNYVLLLFCAGQVVYCVRGFSLNTAACCSWKQSWWQWNKMIMFKLLNHNGLKVGLYQMSLFSTFKASTEVFWWNFECQSPYFMMSSPEQILQKKINPNKVLNLSQVTHQKKWVSLLSMLWMKLWTIWYSPGKTLESSIKLRSGAAQSGEQISHRFIFSLPAISVRFTLPETDSTKSWVQERSCIYRIISTLVQHTVEGTACIPHRVGSCAQSAVKH